MSANAPALTLTHVSKRFGPSELIVDDITLAVAKGEFISIVGASGCGKSTLLRLIAGLIEPTSGVIQMAAPKEGCAYVFQEPALMPWLTAEANVALPLRLRGEDHEPALAKARAWLERVGLSSRRAAFPHTLSGGQKMRVSLARALSVEPSVLLLDEPFAALDELTRHKLNEDLLRLRQEARFTAVFVTHSTNEAVFLGDRVLVMAAGPGRLVDSIPVSFSAPRDMQLRVSLPYLEQVAALGQRLQFAA